jgi:biotin carboxylase
VPVVTAPGRHLLVLPGIGGPTPRLIVPSIGDLASASWIHHAEDLYDTDRDIPAMTTVRDLPLMRRSGEVIAVESDREVVDAARDLHRRRPIDGVLTFSESSVVVAAEIAAELGLRQNSPCTARLLTDKHAQRQALDKAGIPVPAYAPIRSAADIDDAAAEVGFPAVLKPVRGGGSMLTTPVASADQLRDAATAGLATLAATASMRGKARLLRGADEPYLLLEALLPGTPWREDARYGDYVSVESAIYDGAVRHLSVSDKAPLAAGFRENGSFAPSTLPPDRVRLLHETATAALEALGVTHGITHTEIKLTADGPRIIEVNGRLGGGVWRLLELSADYDVMAEAAHAALGLRPMCSVTPVRHAAFLTPCLDADLSGRALTVTVDPAFAGRPGVCEFLDARVSTFDVTMGGGIAALAVVTGSTADEVQAHALALRESITVGVPE